MLNYTIVDLAKSTLGTVAFAVFGVAPGYCVGWAANLFDFRRLSLVERSLWSVAMSLPVSLLAVTSLGRVLPGGAILGCFVALAAVAAGLLGWEWRGAATRPRVGWSREATVVSVAMLALAAYCLLTVVGVQVGHSLFESSVSQDWGVRTALVQSAFRSGVPPNSPFFAVAGHSVSLRYYYFWYEICAQVMRLTGIDAKSALAASCVWSGYGLVAVVFLCLKYLPTSGQAVRRLCTVSLLAECVMGLDILPAIVDLFLWRRRLYPDLEFWHDDRSPSWLGSLVWAPHHVGGLVCCMLGLLFVVAIKRRMTGGRVAMHVVMAAVCFSAGLGTSTFISGFFLPIGAMLLAERLWHREWVPAGALLATGMVCVALSLPYVREIAVNPATSEAATHEAKDVGSHHHLLKPFVRSMSQAHRQMNYVIFRVWKPANLPLAVMAERIVRVFYALAFEIAEFGFYLFVLAYQIRKDFRSGRRMSRDAALWWMVFAGFALPGFLLTSGELQGNNDLGRHAGLCMRFVLLMWAAPLVSRYLQERRDRVPHAEASPLVMRLAVAMFFLGLAGQAWQIAILRLYLPLVDAGKIASIIPAHRFPHVAGRFYDMREVVDTASPQLPLDGILQGNPVGRMEMEFSLYSHRRMAAVDDGCAVPFGGDPELCTGVALPLIQMFGGSGMLRHGGSGSRLHLAMDPSKVTPAAFEETCRAQALAGVIVTYADAVWRVPDSWVWLEQPIAANRTARIYRCPVKEQPAGE